ncbi:unnamed protein product [Allacma fusca]|uniref:Ammonium transporter n=1 Tax=Allacma fusca TaxID=39272 RepID=A0A8J2P0I9_9HEXA|nr:unnamed protein product [Allacma fusca]
MGDIKRLFPEAFSEVTEQPSSDLGKLFPEAFTTERSTAGIRNLFPEAFTTKSTPGLQSLFPEAFTTERTAGLKNLFPEAFTTERTVGLKNLFPEAFTTERTAGLQGLFPEAFSTGATARTVEKIIPPHVNKVPEAGLQSLFPEAFNSSGDINTSTKRNILSYLFPEAFWPVMSNQTNSSFQQVFSPNVTDAMTDITTVFPNQTDLLAENGPLEIPHFDNGEVAWLLACTAITWLMIPGVGFFYNGMAPRKSSLVLIVTCLWSVALVSIQWYIIGYTLCLSNTGGPFIGNVDHLFLMNIGASPAASNPEVPALLVGIWYCLFAAITPTIIIGAVAERARFLPSVIFIFIWSTVVFDFLTYWTWNPNGWTYLLGALDFGGGTPVHISTGFAALAYALVLGKRDNPKDKPPHNMTHVILGTSFIWFGWLVANAGSGLKPNLRAVVVFITTNMAASIGGVTWAAMDYRKEKKFSAFGFCCGAVCGLVAITPASGYVSPSSSLVFGFLGAVCCNICLSLKRFLPIDDAFDVFCVHGIGGIVGNVLTGIFAQKSVPAVDGTHIEGGWVDGNWKQVGIQLLDTLVGGAWSFIWTLVILFVINKIPGLNLRVPVEVERQGIDRTELGESMYQHLDDIVSTENEIPKKNGVHNPVFVESTERNNVQEVIKNGEEVSQM